MKSRPSLFRRLAAVIAAPALVGSGLAVVAVAAPAAAPTASAVIGQCPPGFLPGPGNTNPPWTDDNVSVYAGGDFTLSDAAAEVEGLLVVEGDATFDKSPGGLVNLGWVGVGSALAPTPGGVMLAVGGDLTVGASTRIEVGAGARDADGVLRGGQVNVGGSADPVYPSVQYELNNGGLEVGMGASAISPWSDFGTRIATSSAEWVATPTTGTASATSTDLNFAGDGSSALQVFTISAAELTGRSTVNFTGIPFTDDAAVVINVVGAQDITFNPNYFSDEGVRADDLTGTLFGRVAQRTMWNFVDATSVDFGGASQFLGSVLSPTAPFDITASMNGRVYSGDDILFHGGGNEVHNYPWNGPGGYDCIPVPTPEPDTGSLTLTKILATEGVVATDREFAGWLECVDGRVQDVFYKEGSVRAGTTVTVRGVPLGSTCTVEEDPDLALPGQDPVPPGFVWAQPVWTVNGEVVAQPQFEVQDAETAIAITATNTLLGSFSVTKQVTGPAGGYIGDRAFDVDYTCTAGAYGDDGLPLDASSASGTLAVAAGQTAVSPLFPVGTACDISEATPTTSPDDFSPSDGFQWQEPVITPAQVTIGQGDASPAAVTVTNTYTAVTGSFVIEKSLEPAGIDVDGAFTIAYACGPDGPSGVVDVVAGQTSAPISAPVGSVCTVTEPELPTAPDGWQWGEPTISGSPVSITAASAEDPLTVSVTNRLTSVVTGTGSFTIRKEVVNSGGLAYADSFSGSVVCTSGGATTTYPWTVRAGATTTATEVPVGSACTVSEDAPAAAAGGSWEAAVITPASFTVDAAGATIAVTVSNTLRPSLPASGGTVPWWAIAVGGGLVLVGAIALVLTARRRRGGD